MSGGWEVSVGEREREHVGASEWGENACAWGSGVNGERE